MYYNGSIMWARLVESEEYTYGTWSYRGYRTIPLSDPVPLAPHPVDAFQGTATCNRCGTAILIRVPRPIGLGSRLARYPLQVTILSAFVALVATCAVLLFTVEDPDTTVLLWMLIVFFGLLVPTLGAGNVPSGSPSPGRAPTRPAPRRSLVVALAVALSKAGGRPPWLPLAARRATWSDRSGMVRRIRRCRSAWRVESCA
ncbi:hypothetical protein GCM10010199_01590 [Dactylosporangium roseum]